MIFKNKLKLVILLGILFFWMGCVSDESNKCEGDKLDEDWTAIVENEDCNAEQKGEAYLALGGFNYFKWVEDSEASIVDVLSLTASNWSTKLAYFLKALNITRPLYLSGSNSVKTTYFFAAFLTMNVYLSGTLDNGVPDGTTAFDGNIESSEVDAFTGTSVNDNSGDSDGTTLSPTQLYQFQSDDLFYVWDTATNKVYEDTLDDGSADSEITTPATVASLLADPTSWTVVNQVAYLDELTDPLSGQGDPDSVIVFTSNLLTYLGDLENAMLGLGIDSSSDSIKQIIEFRAKLDNGAQCTSLKDNPNLGLAQLFVANTQKEQITDGSYKEQNNFSITELATLGESDVSSDSSSDIFSVEPGIKMLFKAGTTYIPYWNGADPAIKTAMTNMALFGTSDVKAGDGVMTFSEVICASELLSQ